MSSPVRGGPPPHLEGLLLVPYAMVCFVVIAPLGWVLGTTTGAPWWAPGLVYLATAPVSLLRWFERITAGRGCARFSPSDGQRVAASVRRVESRALMAHRRWLFVLDDSDAMNAYTSGRHTVGVTRAALQLPDPFLDAVIAHELAHQWNRDTWSTAMRSWLLAPVRVFTRVAHVAGLGCAAVSVFFGAALIPALVLALLIWVIMVPVVAMLPLTAWVQRRNELAADACAGRLGYRSALCALLVVSGSSRPTGRWARWVSTHPDSEVRLLALGTDEERRSGS